MAVQTISAQVHELENALGHQLLKPSGRGVAMTDAGQAAFSRAEEIFQLGQMIPDEVREAATGKVARLAVGMSDGISKLAVHALLEPVLATPSLRLVCHEGNSRSYWQNWRCIAWTSSRAVRAAGAAQPEPSPDD